MALYVLKYCTGEYEDYTETILGYSDDMNKLEKAKRVLKEQYADFADNDYWEEEYTKDKLYELQLDSTGVWFKIEEITEIKEIL